MPSMNRKPPLTVSTTAPSGPAYEVVLDALGDRTRRAILQRLRDGPKPVVEIARGLPVSRPAVSQHLKILKGAGLVVDRAEGNRRLYTVDVNGLAALRTFLEFFWQHALSRFVEVAEAEGHTSPSD
jgi:DNA-binding transcriptional ArsR family regulator